ncbi:hypothetical protein [Parathermosynechococcus lividus]
MACSLLIKNSRATSLTTLWALLTFLAIVSASSSAFAQGKSLPQPNTNGDYLRTGHREWQVVDPDPQGLNCRWSNQMPQQWYAPNAQFPDMDVITWPVVARF